MESGLKQRGASRRLETLWLRPPVVEVEGGAGCHSELKIAAVAARDAMCAWRDRMRLVEGVGPVATVNANGTAGTAVVVVDHEICAAVVRGDLVTAEARFRAGLKPERAEKKRKNEVACAHRERHGR